MLEIYKVLPHSFHMQSYFPSYKNEDIILFDIETTGFSPFTSQLYLIGCIYFKNESWILHQFFAETSLDQKNLLLQFFKLCDSFKYMIHFNGDTFDIPYLEKKSSTLHITSPLRNLKSIDILKQIRPFQKILGLENCKLKTIESFLKINRTDPYTGGELIKQYLNYCKKPNECLREHLLLHNEEDLYGLIEILKIYDIITYIQNMLKPHFFMDIVFVQRDNDNLLFSLKALDPSPFPLVIKEDHWVCHIEKGKSIINFEVTLLNDVLRHYFANYKEYYYLPEQDEAIHKSVGAFLPKEKRRTASASNCYIKKSGLFMKVLNKHIRLPIFRQSLRSKETFIHIDENHNVLDNKMLLIELVIDFINSLLPNMK